MPNLPYNPDSWARICLTPGGDGPIEPQPAADNAQDALDQMPDGTRARFLTREVPNPFAPASVAALYDRSDEARLSADRARYPSVWVRTDSAFPRDDLTSYTRLVHFDALESFDEVARDFDAVILLSPDVMPIQLRELPAITIEA